MKLNCLVFNTKILSQIEDILNEFVVDRLQNEQSVKFPQVYKDLRDAGIEVDMESAGAIYNDIFVSEGSLFSSESEIEQIVGADIRNHQNEIVKKFLGESTPKTEQIGKLSPEKSIAKNIASMFDRLINKDAPANVKTVMKQLQDLVKKAVVSQVPNIPAKSKESIHSMLDYFFSAESKEFERLDGSVNNLETLHKAVKKEVKKYVDGIVDKLSPDEAAIVREQWEKHTDTIMNGMYEVMLGKGQQNQLLQEALEQLEIGGEKLVDKNGNIKWSKLSESGNVDKVKSAIKELFKNGVKDRNGNVQSYTDVQAERIAEHIAKRYEDKLIAYKQKQLANQRVKEKSPKNVISDFIKDLGLFHLAKKNGVFEGSVSEWKKVLEKVQSQTTKEGKKDAIEEIKDAFRQYLNGKNIEGVEEKVLKLETLINEKLLPDTATPNAIQRLIALGKVNNGIAFEQSKQHAINKLVGVTNLDQATLDKLSQISAITQQIIAQPTTGANSGFYNLQAHQQIHRLIREIVEANQGNKSEMLVISRAINDIMTTATGSLLLNPYNILENILTAVATNFTAMVTDPIYFSKTIGGNVKTFWTAFFSHWQGGAFGDVISDGDVSNSLSTGEKYRIRKYVDKFREANTVKEYAKAYDETLLAFPIAIVNLLQRYIMNSFDVAFHSVMLRRQMLNSTYEALQNSGFTRSETFKLLDGAVTLTDVQKSRINDDVGDHISAMESIGLHPTLAQRDLMRLEMQMGSFENTLGDYVDANLPTRSREQSKESIRALLKAANNVAKGLGGKKQLPTKDYISQFIYAVPRYALYLQQNEFKDAKKNLEEGRYDAAAYNEFFANLLGKNGFAKFAGGVANFLNLGVGWTPFGGFQVWSLNNQLKKMRRGNTQVDNLFESNADDLAKYYELYNLRKHISARAIMGSVALGVAIGMYYSGDEDDDDELLDGVARAMENLNQTKSGRRFEFKSVPMSIYLMSILCYPPKGDPRLSTKSELLLEVASNVLNKNFDGWDMFRNNMSKAETDAQVRNTALAALSSVWVGNANQIEQITRANHVVASMFDKDFIKKVKNDEGMAKRFYQDMNTLGDAYLGNGIMSTFFRATNGEEPINRFQRK